MNRAGSLPGARTISRAAYGLIATFSIPLTAPAHAAPSSSMEDFLIRADRLITLGPLAIAAPDAHRLKAEVIDAARSYKTRNDAQRKAGEPRRSCPPETGEMEPEEWLSHLRSFPAALRPRLSISFALERYMEKRFPCTAG